MKTKKPIFLISLILVSLLTFGQTNPASQNQIGHLNSNGTSVKPSYKKLSTTNKANVSASSNYTGINKTGESNYSATKQDVTKKKGTHLPPKQGPYPKKAKLYKLTVPKAKVAGAFDN